MRMSGPAPRGAPELFVGLAYAVGTDVVALTKAIRVALEQVGYSIETIRLSDLLQELKLRCLKNFDPAPEFERIDTLMTAGDELRRTTKRPDALAVLACGRIPQLRKEAVQREGWISRRAYVFHSLKTPEEVDTLREIYGRAFFLVSAHCPREVRVKRLADRIAASVSSSKVNVCRAQAEELITRDGAEEDDPYGQRLRDTFPRADVFVNASDSKGLKDEMNRFVQIVFGSVFLTPTRDEYGMFHAKAAALRSADLSRQVGAAIAWSDGEIVAVGTNEVPKCGGGLYWPKDDPDQRDFVRGCNPNADAKRRILSEVLERLRAERWLGKKTSGMSMDVLTKRALKVMANTRLMDLGEFGRTVHAEMAALVDAARRGVSILHGTLYTTTFPCHMCAKHIVAAGIDRVVYVEPYPKSMAEELHDDSIAVDSHGKMEKKVMFEPFIGVAPRRYAELFTPAMRRTTDEGIPISEPTRGALPVSAVPYWAYANNEQEYFKELSKLLSSKRLLKKR